MSLKTSFASVLKAMRATREISQRTLAEVSSRTYISKLERGQCSPTLEMITALSTSLGVSPLTLIALTISTQDGQSAMSLVKRLEVELMELAGAGALIDVSVPLKSSLAIKKTPSQSRRHSPLAGYQQGELCFSD